MFWNKDPYTGDKDRWRLPKVKPKRPDRPLVASNIDDKPHLLHVGRWDMDQSRNT